MLRFGKACKFPEKAYFLAAETHLRPQSTTGNHPSAGRSPKAGPPRLLPALFAVVTLAFLSIANPPASSNLAAAGTGLIGDQLDQLLRNRPLSTAQTSVLVLDALSAV